MIYGKKGDNGMAGTTIYNSTDMQDPIDFFTKKLKNKEPFCFVKRGDGEEFCMADVVGANCDGHTYSKELGDKLKEAYDYFAKNDNCYVPLFNDQYFFNTFLHRIDKNNEKVSNFFKAVRDDDRKKIYVAPERLAPVATLLKADHIVVPLKNAFNDYKKILINLTEKTYDKENPDHIILFSSGMMSKALIHELISISPNKLTCIDVGSSFDPLIDQTRTLQITKEEMLKLYEI
jgi:hypothetical protein